MLPYPALEINGQPVAACLYVLEVKTHLDVICCHRRCSRTTVLPSHSSQMSSFLPAASFRLSFSADYPGYR